MGADVRGTRPGFTREAIHLLVARDRNRRLLADQLAGDYDVTESSPDRLAEVTFDLCIVDARSFERHRDVLESIKDRESPVFLPYVLLADRSRIEHLPDEVWAVVDEVLLTPIDRSELVRRVENMLQRRRLSLEVDRRSERNEERFRTLFEAAPDPILVASPDGVVVDVNDAFSRTFEIDRDRAVGGPITDFAVSPRETIERLLLRDDEGTDDAGTDTVEWELESGERIVTEVNADVVVTAGGTSDRIGIFRDVTEREEREAVLRRQNERLKGFASTIAHDLRNPLTIARGHLELVGGPDDEHFAAVDRAHERMEQLIDEVLTLAREGQVVLEPTALSVEAAARTAWRHVETNDATLSVDADDVILADEGRLVELLENLFRNARQHGGDEVAVRVGRLVDEPGFYVSDDGPGVPESDREEVFEAGYSTSEGGTGFGLSIVRQIAEGHGWDVALGESEWGGARFEFTGVQYADGRHE